MNDKTRLKYLKEMFDLMEKADATATVCTTYLPNGQSRTEFKAGMKPTLSKEEKLRAVFHLLKGISHLTTELWRSISEDDIMQIEPRGSEHFLPR